MMVAEDLGLAMTGGDCETVLHCLESGKTKEVLGFGVTCLLRFGSVVALTTIDKTVRFFDLIDEKMLDITPVNTGFFIYCMQLCVRRSLDMDQYSQLVLFLGGLKSTKIMEIRLPKALSCRSIGFHIFVIR
jgi:hypothetical protein